MAAQILLALGIVLIVVLFLAVRTRPGNSDDHEDPRRLISEEIEAHIDTLAVRYLAARSGQDGGRPATDRFGQEIELFIAEVLLPRAERAEPWLREELREILVLERAAIYREIRKRVAAHLREPFLAA
jgi:hypothetical protein